MASVRPRPGILEIEPYVGGKAEIEGADRVIKLSANESALGPSPRAVAAIKAAAEDAHRYPDGAASALCEAIGRSFQLDPAKIVCGAGSDELIQLLIRLVLVEIEDELFLWSPVECVRFLRFFRLLLSLLFRSSKGVAEA